MGDSMNIAQGFAYIPVAWATGATVGPLIGGQLAKPHNRWPNVFSHPFWVEYPYFLPCGAAAAFSAVCFVITALFLKETVKKRRRLDSSEEGSSDTHDDAPPPLHSVLTRPVLVSVVNYGVLALVEISFLALLPLFLATPIKPGGLGLPPSCSRSINDIKFANSCITSVEQRVWSTVLTANTGTFRRRRYDRTQLRLLVCAGGQRQHRVAALVPCWSRESEHCSYPAGLNV
ncbi:hypothetical protein GY45DRAFT_1328131 [Cubamyces sp. BRFM 1775]|nr:hypothetical protein GY45DRAFT_1328131 [Cubamyces sp. BRFM 1775]